MNMVETEGVEEFLANAAHTKLTAVPQGNLIVCGYRTWYRQTSVSDPDPHWIRIESGLWIRLRILNSDPDPGGQK